MSPNINDIDEIVTLAQECGAEYLEDNLTEFEKAVEKLVEAIAKAISELCAEFIEIFGRELCEGEAERRSPVWFAREMHGKERILLIYGREEVCRARQYARRHYPCTDH